MPDETDETGGLGRRRGAAGCQRGEPLADLPQPPAPSLPTVGPSAPRGPGRCLLLARPPRRAPFRGCVPPRPAPGGQPEGAEGPSLADPPRGPSPRPRGADAWSGRPPISADPPLGCVRVALENSEAPRVWSRQGTQSGTWPTIAGGRMWVPGGSRWQSPFLVARGQTT